MSDLDEWKAFLAKFGIPFAIEPKSDGEQGLLLEAKSADTVIGYAGFVTSITFNEDGKFLHVGIWE